MFEGKKVLVCGLKRSGLAAIGLLQKHRAVVTGTDTATTLFDEGEPRPMGVELILGTTPEGFVHKFDFVIISPGISIYAGFVQKAKKLGIPVWGEAELAFYFCPCDVVGITGTNGKTTVTTLVYEIMKKHNPGAVVAGNIGVPLCDIVPSLRENDIVVAEVSSFQLETMELFRPKISCVLNMTPDHLDRHGSMEVYIAMKEKIFKNQRQNDKVVLNYDNSITKKMKPHCNVIYFSQQTRLESGVFAHDGVIYAKDERLGERPIAKTSKIKVLTENALAATAICLAAGASAKQIKETLENFSGVEHRLELVSTVDGVEYYNDSKATNVDAAIKALESFTRPVVLIAGGHDKGADFAPWVGLFKDKVSFLVLLGDTAEQIRNECFLAGFTALCVENSLENAVNIARKMADGVVLLSPGCASFGMFTDFEDRGRQFKELVYAMEN